MSNRILVADDDFTSRAILKGILEKCGYSVVTAVNGTDALEKLRADEAPRLAILDWIMPDISGPDLCRKLKNEPRTRSVYAILLTSKNETGDTVAGLDAGADDFVTKPADMLLLRSRINAGFRILGLQQELREYGEKMEFLAQQRAEQLAHAERMTTIGLLSAGIAHEINNPVSFLSVNIQTLEQYWENINRSLRGIADEEETELTCRLSDEMPVIFREMKTGIDRIREIVSGLKSFARTDDSNRNFRPVNTCVENALKLCMNQLKHGVDVRKSLSEGIPDVPMHGNQLEQVCVNLIVNAVDAMVGNPPDSKKQLDVRTFIESGNIQISVRDTGPGIPVGLQKTVFQPFFTTKPPGKGTGLGLYICRDIVEKMKGRLEIDKSGPEGTGFLITLPIPEIPD